MQAKMRLLCGILYSTRPFINKPVAGLSWHGGGCAVDFNSISGPRLSP